MIPEKQIEEATGVIHGYLPMLHGPDRERCAAAIARVLAKKGLIAPGPVTEQKWVDPASCPTSKHYTGIVRTNLGTHGRILQRYDNYSETPWVYYKEECSTPSFATDDDVSELQELDPFVHRHLNEAENKAADLSRELYKAERTIEALKEALNKAAKEKEGHLTESRVRELAREEINRTSWQLHGLTITHKEQQ